MRVSCQSLALVLGVVVASCSRDNEVVGTRCASGGVGTSALNVFVRDARTNLPAARGASLIGVRAPYGPTDSIRGGPFDDSTLVTAGIPGTWQLTIKKTGYQDWTGKDIVVGEEAICGKVFSVSAALQPIN